MFSYLRQLINKSLLIDKRSFLFNSARSIPDNQPSNSWLWSNQIKWPFYFLLEKTMVLQHFWLTASKKLEVNFLVVHCCKPKTKSLNFKLKIDDAGLFNINNYSWGKYCEDRLLILCVYKYNAYLVEVVFSNNCFGVVGRQYFYIKYWELSYWWS